MTDRHGLLGWLERLVEESGAGSPKKRPVYRNHCFWRGTKGKCAATDGAYAVFSRFRAIKLTKRVAGSGYFPVSVLVLPGLARSHCVKRAVSKCQVEPNPDFGIYNPTRRGYGRGCQIQKIGLDG
jgi:hypothetical protein